MVTPSRDRPCGLPVPQHRAGAPGGFCGLTSLTSHCPHALARLPSVLLKPFARAPPSPSPAPPRLLRARCPCPHRKENRVQSGRLDTRPHKVGTGLTTQWPLEPCRHFTSPSCPSAPMSPLAAILDFYVPSLVGKDLLSTRPGIRLRMAYISSRRLILMY